MLVEAAASNFRSADGRSASSKEDHETTLFPVKLTQGNQGYDAVMRALKRGLDASRAAEGVSKQSPNIWGALGETLKKVSQHKHKLGALDMSRQTNDSASASSRLAMRHACQLPKCYTY